MSEIYSNDCVWIIQEWPLAVRRENLAVLRKLGFQLVLRVASVAVCLVLLHMIYLSSGNIAIERFINKSNMLLHQGIHIIRRSKNSVKVDTDSKTLNIVTQFPVITNGSDTELTLLRQKEYVETLKKNIAHPQVSYVHILLEKDEDVVFLEELNIAGREKIVYHPLNRRMLYGDAFRYVSDFLRNKNAVIINADCYIGKGFEKLDPDILSQKTIYALTRHEPSYAMEHCNSKNLCSSSVKYIGSHDAFALHLKKPLPDSLLETLMIRPDIVGVEKFVIFNLRKMGGFEVKNPCRILYIFHNHCSQLRHGELRFVHGKRLNNLYISRVPRQETNAPFSGL